MDPQDLDRLRRDLLHWLEHANSILKVTEILKVMNAAVIAAEGCEGTLRGGVECGEEGDPLKRHEREARSLVALQDAFKRMKSFALGDTLQAISNAVEISKEPLDRMTTDISTLSTRLVEKRGAQTSSKLEADEPEEQLMKEAWEAMKGRQGAKRRLISIFDGVDLENNHNDSNHGLETISSKKRSGRGTRQQSGR